MSSWFFSYLGDEPGGLTFLFLFSFSLFFLSSVSANKISRLAIEDFSVSQAHVLSKVYRLFPKIFEYSKRSTSALTCQNLCRQPWRTCSSFLHANKAKKNTSLSLRVLVQWGRPCGNAAASSARSCNQSAEISLLVKGRRIVYWRCCLLSSPRCDPVNVTQTDIICILDRERKRVSTGDGGLLLC